MASSVVALRAAGQSSTLLSKSSATQNVPSAQLPAVSGLRLSPAGLKSSKAAPKRQASGRLQVRATIAEEKKVLTIEEAEARVVAGNPPPAPPPQPKPRKPKGTPAIDPLVSKSSP
jgi:hypothetical protein